jgi:hypothetical protein
MVTLDNIVPMDESAVFLHTSKTKEQSLQWLVSLAQKEGQGPSTRTKQMVLAFFNSKGLIYTNHMPWGPR